MNGLYAHAVGAGRKYAPPAALGERFGATPLTSRLGAITPALCSRRFAIGSSTP